MTDWWKRAVVYQIYPKSFKDSNGDGIGDLNGITQKLDYLKALGIDVIWISPMYCSPMVDNGYDISDYYKVNPIFGTNKDMELLLEEAKKRDIKIILDLVVNHCSDKHEWFEKAKADPACKEADYFYFFHTEDGKAPNNWRSNFGGSVWTQLPDGRWYFHTFAKEQPDLNWENKELREEIYKMICWWLEKGVAGFRIDAITFIKKDLSFTSKETTDGQLYPIEELTDYPGIECFLQEMKERCFEKYDCMTVAEAPGVGTEAFEKYAGTDGFFSMIFDFTWENMEGEADKSEEAAVERWKKRIYASQKQHIGHGWSGIFLENHDQSRCVNKFLEKKDISFFSASALGTIYMFLQGTPFIYEGQEIGMTNTTWDSIDEMDDVRAKGIYEEAVKNHGDPRKALQFFEELGRDNARTPMQWDDSENAGFSSVKPWLKVNENYPEINVLSQEKNPDSLLTYYRKLSHLHHEKSYEDIIVNGSFKPVMEEIPALIAYERTWKDKTLTVVVNLKNKKQEISCISAKQLINNYAKAQKNPVKGEKQVLEPFEAVVFDGKI